MPRALTVSEAVLTEALAAIEGGALSIAGAAQRYGIPEGTLKARRSRARAEAATKPAPQAEVSTPPPPVATPKPRPPQVATQAPAPPPPEPRRPAPDVESPRCDDLLSDRQWLAIYALVEGCTVTEAARRVGVDRDTIGSWRGKDKVFAARLAEVRADLHNATIEKLKHVAQTGVEAGLVAIHELVKIITAQKEGGGYAESAYDRAQAARALGPLLNTFLAHGGYPKTEKVEHVGEVALVPRLSDLFHAEGPSALAELAARVRERRSTPAEA